MSEIEKFFDEDNWIKFSSLFENKLDEKSGKLTLIEILENDTGLANVIFAAFGIESLAWINQKIPALDNLTPKECLVNDKLKNRLKECLMRMPW
jgi:hypothetical protein